MSTYDAALQGLSNMMKTISDTEQSIVQNLKP